ncbi:MAG: hypothetical protein J7604_26075, partial [Sporocytophaga sp.]|uniref:hypothetical protein n=1 Tax=Sporocytophaga sp. TaxID=2231183 RepID=UPI001B10E532
KNIAFWSSCLIVSLILIAVYLYIYYKNTGDFFYRIRVIQEGHYTSPYSYYDKDINQFIGRLTYEPLLMLIATGMITLVLFSVIPLLVIPFIKIKLPESYYYWAYLSIYMLLFFLYGSSNLKAYNPLPLFGRMFLPVIPVMAMASAFFLYYSLGRINSYIGGFLFLLIGIFAWLASMNMFIVYLLLAVLFFVKGSLGIKMSSIITFITLFFILNLYGINRLRKSKHSGFYEQFVFEHYLNSRSGLNLVITDLQLVEGNVFYNNFIRHKNYKFVEFQNGSHEDFRNYNKVYYLYNQQNFENLDGTGINIPATSVFYNCKKILFNKGGVCLCEAK